MKILFIFFAVLNIVFYLWQSTHANPNTGHADVDRVAQDKDVQLLVLVNEVDQSKVVSKTAKASDSKANKDAANSGKKQSAQAQRPTSPANEQVASNAHPGDAPKDAGNIEVEELNCYTLGPFEGLPQLQPVADQLEEMGVDVKQRVVNDRFSTGFWVYLPNFQTWKQARKQVVQLEEKGIKDLFIMGRGNLKNAISLGLYKNRQAANERVAQLQKFGISPSVDEQFNEAEKYWLDIDIDAKQTNVLNSIKKITESLSVLDLIPRKCG